MELEIENQWVEEMDNEENIESEQQGEEEENIDAESIQKLAPPKAKKGEIKRGSNWNLTIHSPIKKRCKGRPPTKRKQSKVDTIVKIFQKKSKKSGKKNISQPNLIDLNVPSEEALTSISNEGLCSRILVDRGNPSDM
ncbi:hypothetical protein POM88_022210 [Heracleum sosnowskyi]|uniref:Uncharacterized protein n=1 Tax=Heracleum sosnowskyi TaxID=360622 RepID=A0AAD8IIF7_9APIA|nr:hypothetical protein POM88_022210 [Heracleum sosnowskyi]